MFFCVSNVKVQLMQAYMLNSVNLIRTEKKLINKIRSNSALTPPLHGPLILTKKPGIYTCSWTAVTEQNTSEQSVRDGELSTEKVTR